MTLQHTWHTLVRDNPVLWREARLSAPLRSLWIWATGILLMSVTLGELAAVYRLDRMPGVASWMSQMLLPSIKTVAWLLCLWGLSASWMADRHRARRDEIAVTPLGAEHLIVGRTVLWWLPFLLCHIFQPVAEVLAWSAKPSPWDFAFNAAHSQDVMISAVFKSALFALACGCLSYEIAKDFNLPFALIRALGLTLALLLLFFLCISGIVFAFTVILSPLAYASLWVWKAVLVSTLIIMSLGIGAVLLRDLWRGFVKRVESAYRGEGAPSESPLL